MTAVRGAAAAVLVVLALGGCGRAGGPDHGASSGALGASAASTRAVPGPTREDVPTPTATGPATGAVASLQQALDAAGTLADEVDRDIASDGS